MGALNHPKSMTTISSGVTGATASVISSSATNSPYSTNKSGTGAAATVAGATHVAFADSVGADPTNVAAVPSIESGERYMSYTLFQPKCQSLDITAQILLGFNYMF